MPETVYCGELRYWYAKLFAARDRISVKFVLWLKSICIACAKAMKNIATIRRKHALTDMLSSRLYKIDDAYLLGVIACLSLLEINANYSFDK